MTRCVEFYQKWANDPNWCEKCKSGVSQINSYLALLDEFQTRGLSKKFTMVNLSERAARPLFAKRNSQIRDQLIETIAEGLRTEKNPLNGLFFKKWTVGDVNKLCMKVRQAKKASLVSSDDPIAQKVVQCEISNAKNLVKENSVDLILTDPPYIRESLTVWNELAEFAKFALKDGAILIAYSGQSHLPETIAALSSRLNYVWCCALSHKGGLASMYSLHFKIGWKPLLLFSKGTYQPKEAWFTDLIQGGGTEKDLHEWQQSVGDLAHILSYFTSKGSFVVDPFCGSGTTLIACKNLDRNFLGLDKDPDIVKVAQGRLCE